MYLKATTSRKSDFPVNKIGGNKTVQTKMKDDKVIMNFPLKVAVLGSPDVGKSALTVRYLTKRFIGEYRSDIDMLYRCVLQVDGSSHSVEIMDTSSTKTYDVNERHFQWAEAFVIIYDVTNKESFEFASQTLKDLSQNRPSARALLVGNKNDLSHSREVEEIEARSLALTHAARFHEVSTAESCDAIASAVDSFLKDVKSYRFINNNHVGGSPKQRKLSVTKMLGSLIGRHSPPPQPITELIVLDKQEWRKISATARNL